MKVFSRIQLLIFFVLTKMGISLPQKLAWQEVWKRRGDERSVDKEDFDSIDGRCAEDQKNAISAVAQQIIEFELIQPNGTWLDVGIGSGVMHSSLKEQFPLATSVGCDYSYPSLAFCKQTHDIPVVNCLAQQLPFSSGCVDFILFYSVSHYLENKRMFLALLVEFGRILKPGGTILIGDVCSYENLQLKYFNPHWFYPNVKKLDRHLRRLELSIDVVPQPKCAPYRDWRVDWILRKEVNKATVAS